jgi:homoserine kinase
VAPCLLGGLTIAWTGAAGGEAVRLEPSADVHPFAFVPQERGLTETARAALPAAVPHGDAAFNAARSALLVHALTRDPARLLVATEDRLHQPYRAVSMPGTAALVAELRAQGVAAVVSGAGPSVLALATAGWTPPAVAGWLTWPLTVDTAGALLEDAETWGTLEHAERDPVAAGWTS